MALWRGALSLAVLAVALAASPAVGAGERAAFGGSGQDALYEAVRTADGLFAVGKTFSSDGDLEKRSRMGEAGWALRVGEAGGVQWSFSSAHNGLLRMTSPHAFEDGTLSCVLTEETGQRGEWIVLDEAGRQVSRTAIPDAQALCTHGGHVQDMLAYAHEGRRALTVLLSHPGDGTLCCARLLEDGTLLPGTPFEGDALGCAAMDERAGVLVHMGVRRGELCLTRVTPGEDVCGLLALSQEGVTFQRVCDVVVCEDGSVALCGQAISPLGESEGFVMRVNAQGEMLFCVEDAAYGSFVHMAATDEGFAVYGCGNEREAACAVLFFDEDGALLGAADAGLGAQDVVGAPGGIAALYHAAGVSQGQAVIERIALQETPGAADHYAGSLYVVSDCVLMDARFEGGAVTLLCRRADGMADVTRVDERGNVLLRCAAVAEGEQGFAAPADDGGVLVALAGENAALLAIDAMGGVERRTLPTARQILPGETGQTEAMTVLACENGALLCARAEDARVLVRTDDAGAFAFTLAVPRDAAFSRAPLRAQTLDDGWLVYGQGGRGAQVLRVSGSGELLWRAHTPVTTAADALEWLCAAELEDGSLLLAGRCLTGEDDAARQEGMIALLGSGGELREIRSLKDVGAVRDIAAADGCVYMLACSGEQAHAPVDCLITESGETLSLAGTPVMAEGVRLIAGDEGLLLAGMAADSTVPTVLLQRAL